MPAMAAQYEPSAAERAMAADYRSRSIDFLDAILVTFRTAREIAGNDPLRTFVMTAGHTRETTEKLPPEKQLGALAGMLAVACSRLAELER